MRFSKRGGAPGPWAPLSHPPRPPHPVQYIGWPRPAPKSVPRPAIMTPRRRDHILWRLFSHERSFLPPAAPGVRSLRAAAGRPYPAHGFDTGKASDNERPGGAAKRIMRPPGGTGPKVISRGCRRLCRWLAAARSGGPIASRAPGAAEEHRWYVLSRGTPHIMGRERDIVAHPHP